MMSFLYVFGYACIALGGICLILSWKHQDKNPRLVIAWRSFFGLAGMAFAARLLLR